MLSIPIPIIKENWITVKYFPYSLKEPHKLLRVNIGEYESVTDLKSKISETLSADDQ